MKVRLKPGGPLHLGGLGITLKSGEEAHVPRSVVERHAGRLEVLEADPLPDPETVDVSAYHVGGGWYDLSEHGEPYKVRKAEAEAILSIQNS